MVTQGCPTHLHLATKGTQSHLSSLSSKKRKKHLEFYSQINSSFQLNNQDFHIISMSLSLIDIAGELIPLRCSLQIQFWSHQVELAQSWGGMWCGCTQSWKNLNYAQHLYLTFLMKIVYLFFWYFVSLITDHICLTFLNSVWGIKEVRRGCLARSETQVGGHHCSPYLTFLHCAFLYVSSNRLP